ncbi:Isoprenyl transferase-like protein [Leptotrombidium deliense]|uniref:ditrans,polycis-polyprenyl diphosphate synthase [(2E,6E)-farnesyldiphosphate specific] n=1 Tax=Leptotrombidium deliense TaxID=299467 RepID=A0A443QVH0_9ACAR|nr:Isoprenyl transferase-like protein [Leptotrombidium deliense]
MRGEKAIIGHIEGVKIIDQVIHFAYACGVKEITSYALSTDNLKRSKEEVKDLMDLIKVFTCLMFDVHFY